MFGFMVSFTSTILQEYLWIKVYPNFWLGSVHWCYLLHAVTCGHTLTLNHTHSFSHTWPTGLHCPSKLIIRSKDTDRHAHRLLQLQVNNVQGQIHMHAHTLSRTHMQSHSHCDSHNHAGENVSLFVKQKSLTESISRQGEWRILDSIKLTASPIGTPLTGPLFNQTMCVCVFVCVLASVQESVCVYLS